MHIVVPDGYTLNPGDNPWSDLAKLGTLTVHERTADEDIIERGRDAEILVINKVRLTQPRLQQLPRLKYITVTATGFDCVDTKAARQQSIPVSNVPVYGTDSVAQFVFALLMHLCHRVGLHDEAVRNGEWQTRGDFSFWKTPQMELAGKTMGIIGFGRIGRRVGELANAAKMKVVAHSRTMHDPPAYHPFAWFGLNDLVSQSDVISVNCPLTPDTRGMIDNRLLSLCKPTAILINASRGGLVAEEDLAGTLNEGRIAAAAVDVVSLEPIAANNPLLTAKNCVITPHMAWATLEARRRLMETTVANVAGFLAGKPVNVVN